MQNLITDYVLHLADNSLILGQQNSAWTGHGPILEQDIALSNISLDLIGQARYFYQHAAKLLNEANGSSQHTEDSLAYLRTEREYKNLLLLEQDNGDWGKTIMRQFLFSSFQLLQFRKLKDSHDPQLKAIAEKSLKEIAYHLRWSSEWVIRLGDGTEESHERMNRALADLWRFTGEFFTPASYEDNLSLFYPCYDPSDLKDEWEARVINVLDEATLYTAENQKMMKEAFMLKGGKEGQHTEKLGYILAEMQYLQRTYPGSEW